MFRKLFFIVILVIFGLNIGCKTSNNVAGDNASNATAVVSRTTQFEEIAKFLVDDSNAKHFLVRKTYDSGSMLVVFFKNDKRYQLFYTGNDAKPFMTFYVKPTAMQFPAESFSAYKNGSVFYGILDNGKKENDKTVSTEQNKLFMLGDSLIPDKGEGYREHWQKRFDESLKDTIEFIRRRSKAVKEVRLPNTESKKIIRA